MSGVLDRLPAALAALGNLSSADVSTWTEALTQPMSDSGIVTERRAAAFLGTVAVESWRFTAMIESGNYSADRLPKVWPTRFPDAAAAQPFAHAPDRLLNHVYADRMGNGDEASGDGFRFRGRGLIQITGRACYQQLAADFHMTIDAAVAWLETAHGAAASAAWFWMLREHHPPLNLLADAWDLSAICRAVNGGYTGLPQRIEASTKALGIFSA